MQTSFLACVILACFGLSRAESTENARPAGVLILGMFDSGTNFLKGLLKENFGFEQCRPAWSQTLLCSQKDLPDFLPEPQIAKHSPPTLKVVQSSILDWLVSHPSVLVVALVRHPFAQMVGWAKAPYELSKSCLRSEPKNLAWETVEGSPCSLPLIIGHKHKVEWVNFRGLTGIWNSYTEGYHNLQQKVQKATHADRFLIVEYEALVLQTEQVLERISKVLGRQLSSFHKVDKSAKLHGESHSYADAVESILNKSWLETIGSASSLLCRNLHMTTVSRHVVIVSPNTTLRYDEECRRLRRLL